MRIYSRDYTKLTPEELNEWELLKEKEIASKERDFVIRKGLYRDYPVAVRHYKSLFPNNHLDIVGLQKVDYLTALIEEFHQLIDNPASNERSILNWIREKDAYFIIASIMKGGPYSFGHHDAFIFPEFQLGNSYQVDFLIVGQSSGGYEFIFVELEHPNKNITLNDGHLGDAIRKGERQVTDWKYWLEANYTTLYETFNKYKAPRETLPIEFMKYDSTRVHYAVVAGRRSDFNERTYQLKRQKTVENILLLHYDNLYDFAKSLIGEATY